MDDLPPDLERLGEALTAAPASTMAARRRRRRLRHRLAACAAVGLLVFAVTTPSRLVPADSTRASPPLTLAATGPTGGYVVLDGPCDTLHGGARRPAAEPPTG